MHILITAVRTSQPTVIPLVLAQFSREEHLERRRRGQKGAPTILSSCDAFTVKSGLNVPVNFAVCQYSEDRDKRQYVPRKC
jgi:hypothetical protein